MYSYQHVRHVLFTEQGVSKLREVSKAAEKLLKGSGAFTAGHLMSEVCGDTWTMMAALDYLCEEGDIRRINQTGKVAGQDEVYVVGSTRKGT